jgi:hypothetical protein
MHGKSRQRRKRSIGVSGFGECGFGLVGIGLKWFGIKRVGVEFPKFRVVRLGIDRVRCNRYGIVGVSGFRLVWDRIIHLRLIRL